MEDSIAAPQKIKIASPYDPAIPTTLLDTFPPKT